MKKLNLFLRKSFDKKIDGTGLAVFRIAYCLVLLCEIVQMFYFRYLIFDKIPYIEHAEIDFGIPISIWFIAVVFVLFGAFTRFFTILNYIMGLILIGSIDTYEYHVFYAYMGVNFVLIFLPISQCLSMDRLFQKLKYSNITFTYNPTKTVSQLYYFVPTFVGIGLVYFDSIFVKLDSNSWLSGLGLWLPASMPMMVQTNLSFILNFKYFMLFLGYFTLAFEALFLFVFFKKKWRIIVFTIGVFFHLGILILWPIPWFALTIISIYLLLIPVSWWQKLFSSDKNSSTLTFYFDSECLLCIRTKIVIKHIDWFNKIGFKTVQFDGIENQYLKNIDKTALLDNIYSVDAKGKIYSGVDAYIQVFKRIFYLYPLAFLLKLPGIYHLANFIAKNRTTERYAKENYGYNPPVVLDDNSIKLLNNFTVLDLKFTLIKFIITSLFVIQLIIIYKSPVLVKIKENFGFKGTVVDNYVTSLISGMQPFTKKMLGSTSHDVFTDGHYIGYNHIIAIVYTDKLGNEIWLPVIDKNGQPSYYNYGTNWKKMSFSTNNPSININNLNSGVRDFTAFWSKKNKQTNLMDDKFLIKVKKIDALKDWQWEKDFLNKQIAKPWIDGGYIEWKDKKFISHIKDIESL